MTTWRDRLNLEAESISTVMTDRIGNSFTDVSNAAAMWQPGPMPEDWIPSDVSIIESDPTTRTWRLPSLDQGEEPS